MQPDTLTGHVGVHRCPVRAPPAVSTSSFFTQQHAAPGMGLHQSRSANPAAWTDKCLRQAACWASSEVTHDCVESAPGGTNLANEQTICILIGALLDQRQVCYRSTRLPRTALDQSWMFPS